MLTGIPLKPENINRSQQCSKGAVMTVVLPNGDDIQVIGLFVAFTGGLLGLLVGAGNLGCSSYEDKKHASDLLWLLPGNIDKESIWKLIELLQF